MVRNSGGNQRRRSICRLGFGVGALLLTSIGMQPAYAETGVTADRIILGQSAALTGPAAQLGKQMHLGAKTYFDAVNASGGVHGRKIELKVLDDFHEPEAAAENTRKLIKDGQVFALFGYVGTPTSEAALPIAAETKVPFFAPYTGADVLRTPLHKHVFHIRAGDQEETAAIVQHIRTTGLKRISVVYNEDGYGKAGLAGIQQALKKAENQSVSLVAQESVIRNTREIGDAISSSMRANPDAIVVISAYRTVGALIKEGRRRGYSGQFYNVSFVGTRALADELGANGSGVIISQVMPHPGNGTLPVVREYQRLLAASGKTDFDYGSMEGFIAAKTFVEALRRAGRNLTRERLVTSLETMTNHDLGGFNVNFSPTRHVGSPFVEMTIINSRGQVIR